MRANVPRSRRTVVLTESIGATCGKENKPLAGNLKWNIYCKSLEIASSPSQNSLYPSVHKNNIHQIEKTGAANTTFIKRADSCELSYSSPINPCLQRGRANGTLCAAFRGTISMTQMNRGEFGRTLQQGCCPGHAFKKPILPTPAAYFCRPTQQRRRGLCARTNEYAHIKRGTNGGHVWQNQSKYDRFLSVNSQKKRRGSRRSYVKFVGTCGQVLKRRQLATRLGVAEKTRP